MKNIFIVLIFIVNLNFCNSQNKIFLPSEEAWVTVVMFSDWIEDNEDDYLGEYKFVYALINDKGEVGDGDGYEEKIQLLKIAGKLVAFSMLNVEGWDETQKDTLHNFSITQNYLNSDRPNLKFVTLSYMDKKKKLKKVRGILDFDGEKTDYFFELMENSVQGKRESKTLTKQEQPSFLVFGKELKFGVTETDFLLDFPQFKKYNSTTFQLYGKEFEHDVNYFCYYVSDNPNVKEFDPFDNMYLSLVSFKNNSLVEFEFLSGHSEPGYGINENILNQFKLVKKEIDDNLEYDKFYYTKGNLLAFNYYYETMKTTITLSK